ncbi:hypothetical protein CKAN_02144300 [Cinnamomum micranthum f. kanehirae]|uniref:Nonsense-mediated mRNA decay factor SMG8 n=1 Tax=Cinnamomum micranthum f. kanehirae TaxID=337451 RepID=A0A3S3NC61_9MAGN|nr:hypothetical protein CKAN_02144300 [Cinnamomum micranthum f. kanehirae]
MEPPNPGLRVLIRPTSSLASSSSSSSSSISASSVTPPVPNPTPTPLRPWSSSSLPPSNPTSSTSSSSLSSQTQAPSFEGVVVVGFIGRSFTQLSHLINRIIDANVFGSGNLDRNLPPHLDDEEKRSWFRMHRISYYYLEEKGIVFLQLSSPQCPLMPSSASVAKPRLDSIIDEHDSEDLRGMLLMFSVCHVIIQLIEGSRFDTQILKKFRMLQAAKNSMAPFIKSHIAPTLNLKVASSQQTLQMTASDGSSSRGGSIMSRHSSPISLMSGLGSYPSLFPGQCTPVILFVFLDDFLDGPVPVSHMEDLPDVSQSSNLSGILRPSVPPMKGSSSIVMLARPISKTDGSLRKKLQSSLEAQIRFLIKKCRTLAGVEASHSGPRGVVNVSSLPLFSLDASRAVTLLDKSTNHKAESLDVIMGIVEEILNQNVASNVLLLENHYQNSHKDDIQSIKEFIYRQSDSMRGRGSLATSANGGSAAGVGMVAAAAAAAAASAASGKSFSAPPELPTMDDWLSCTKFILDILLFAKHGFVDESGISRKLSRRRNATFVPSIGISPAGADAVQAAISCLESGRGLNMKFSTSWCHRALSAAKEVYLKDLPACYPTSQHEAQLMKALQSFKSMAKGPALQMFIQKLEDECTSIWKSGRQLCDAVSLTGKPCVHQRHNVESSHLTSETDVKAHSSGYVFLHACACGRSRQLRDDPFDFASANIEFNCFPNCEKLLPLLKLPKSSSANCLMASSWSLIRVGGARYYETFKGLLQSGFCTNENFLQRWTILVGKWRGTDCVPEIMTEKRFLTRLTDRSDPKNASATDEEMKNTVASQLFQGGVQTGELHNQKNPSLNISSNVAKISFGTGLAHLATKKPFSEVVAGFVASESAFPPLQQIKQSAAPLGKGIKQKGVRDQIEDQIHVPVDYQGSSTSANNSGQVMSHVNKISGHTDGDPVLQIGSNVVPVNVNDGENIKPNTSLKHDVVYVGFEHECSYGHRFLLSLQHLTMLGCAYYLPEESHIHSSTENSDTKADDSVCFHKNIHEKLYPGSWGANACVNKVRPVNVSEETVANHKQYQNGPIPFCTSRKEAKASAVFSAHSKSVKDLEESNCYTPIDNEECAFSLLNRNIPVYMNCPHCRLSKRKKDKIKFASTVSQLQRIFLVTPPFPVVLATCPVVQFEHSCLPPSVPDPERQSQFSLGCRVILPPDSFLTLRLPFVYGVQLEDGSLHPLNHLEHQPELTAWITKGTTLQVVSKEEEFHL